MSEPTATGELREMLADLCHRQWSGWMEYLFSKGEFDHKSNTWTMPAEFVERWQRQLNTPYRALPKSEQDSDRKEAEKFLSLFFEYRKLVRIAMIEYSLANVDQDITNGKATD